MVASYLVDATRSSHSIEGLALERAGYRADDRRGRDRARARRRSALDAVPADVARDVRRRARRPAAVARARPAIADLDRERTRRRVPRSRTAADSRAGRHRARGRARRHRRARRRSASACSASWTTSAAASTRRPAASSTSTRRSSSPKCCSRSSTCSRRRRPARRASSPPRRTCSRSSRSTHELPGLVLKWRSIQKLKGTYVDALPALVNPATGRVHTTFNQAVAATGRLCSSDPNLQNIPIRTPLGREIRAAFVAEPGFVLISADYSQIELRVLAHLSGDAALVEAFTAGHRHPRPHGRARLRRGERPRQARAAAAREDHQLRAALRQDGVHARQGHRRAAAGRAGVHRRLLRRLPRRARVHRPHAGRRARDRRRPDDHRAAGGSCRSSRARTA